MHTTIQPVILTPNLDRLLNFYTELFDAVEIQRVPLTGPPFYIGLQIGQSVLGLVVNTDVQTGTSQRMLISVDVENVDNTLERVVPAGGRVLGPPNNMPWGQRVAHLEDPDGNAVNLTHLI